MNLLNPLNPAAGGVPVPEDEREIEAALRAGVISYRIFPYLEWRYGERGEKFTRSDSAWLAWLTRHPPGHVDEQIAWLRNVLSNRGMPSWILEVHLRVLHRHLVRTIPENKQKYASLLSSARMLCQLSEAGVSSRREQQLMAEFEAALRPNSNLLLRQAAQLLVAALADEKSGVKNAVDSLTIWLGDVPTLRGSRGLRERLSTTECRWFDSDSFQKQWQDAIEATIHRARQD